MGEAVIVLLSVVILLFVADFISRDRYRRENKKYVYRLEKMISVVEKCYLMCVQLDFENWTPESLLSVEEKVVKKAGKKTGSEKLLKMVMEYVVEESRHECMFFIHPTNIKGRLQEEKTVEKIFQKQGGGWVKISFFISEDVKKYVIMTMWDVTEEVRKEQVNSSMARRIEEQERQNEMIRADFMRQVSYDIRTPINGICGMINIANHYPHDYGKQQECRNKIWNAALILQHMVVEILDADVSYRERKMDDRMPFHLYSVMQSVVSSVGVQAKDNHIGFGFEKIRIMNWNLLGSPFYLKRILTRMLENVIYKNKGQGEITISAIETPIDDNWSQFEFSCKGPEDSLDMFSIAEMAERLNGSMDWVPAEPGKTIYRVVIPMLLDSAEGKTLSGKKRHNESRLSGAKILLVEDNELNMEVTEFFFESEGANVIRAYNGKEAVEIFKASYPEEFDVIIMDIVMPVMNGIDASRKIRDLAREDAKKVPIFAVTANSYYEDVEKYYKAGMNEHFFKPFETEEVLEKVARYRMGK